jgi:integrating conjugative element relaxase (TIGR03760 family)
VRGLEGIVEATNTAALLTSVQRKTRLSPANWASDCEPLFQSLAAFVQMLPASECHHHAQPGGLWIHLLEVADAALQLRGGMELPAGASTEDRKRQEFRWTYAVLIAALLHDVAKPVTDVKVTLFKEDPQMGQLWTPLSGPMNSYGVSYYSVAFTDPSERDYKAHAKLASMLFPSFVPGRVIRWLAEDGEALPQLLAYLSGDDPDGQIGSIVKKADMESVRRNLLAGPRTRFASARTRPLIERLMDALQRMLIDGSLLPLNRPGAAGWVFDGSVWFVCARLADEVRSYLSQHESLQGVPGKDKNDRLFDTWQESGAAMSAPDGGAVWRVRVECDNWSPPDALTVLRFPLEKLYADPAKYPAQVRGRVWVASSTPTTSHIPAPTVPAAAAASSQATHPPASQATMPGAQRPAPATSNASCEPASSPPPPPVGSDVDPAGSSTVVTPTVTASPPSRLPAPVATGPGFNANGLHPEGGADVEAPVPEGRPPTAVPAPLIAGETADPEGLPADELPRGESAAAEFAPGSKTSTPELGAPMRPREKGQRPPGAGKAPTPAAVAFMAWVAQSVGSGELRYNEEGALVHFVPEGALLLSPEIFRRFLSEHSAVHDGPIAELRASHGDRAFARLQNELAKSGWTARNGDENLHYYSFIKADKKALSRVASFYLIRDPKLFWNPVPAANDRIRAVPRVKKLGLPQKVEAAAKS